MATGQTFKTGDVIGTLNLVEIRRQQRRVTTLLQGNPKEAPLLSYRQAESSFYRGENLGNRRWPPGGAIHQRTCENDQNERELFGEPFDDLSKGTERFNRTQDYISRPPNNSPKDEPKSYTPLPPIDSHRNNCAPRQLSDVASKKLEKRRQRPPASEQSIMGNGHVTRNRKPSRKPRKISSKPIVKYQHQKVEPSAEERYRKYRQVTYDGAKKVTSGSTPETGLRSGSSLSSVSDVSAVRRRQVMFQDGDEENGHQWGASNSSQLPLETALGIESLRGKVNGGIPGLESPSEDNVKSGLGLDPGRCHSSAIEDGSAWRNEVSVRLPNIEIYNFNRPALQPEPRKWNPSIGETSRAFVFSYFDYLPSVDKSRDDDDLGSDKENQSKSRAVVNMKTTIRRK